MPSFLTSSDIITALYTIIDDSVKEINNDQHTRVGRPSILSDSEVITILIYSTLILHQKNLKDILKFMNLYHKQDFQLPKYTAFINHVHRITPLMGMIMSMTFSHSSINFVDSTMLEVCTLKRSDSYKVAKNIVKFGKNHQGWHYGFKLHSAIDSNGFFSSICFSPANIYDAQMLPKLVKDYMKIIVGDSHYGAKVMREKIWREHNIFIITPPHWKQKTKLATLWQNALLNMRSKIESTFDILKEHFHLVTSFPRSVKGYFVHYLRVLLAYQFSVFLKMAELS